MENKNNNLSIEENLKKESRFLKRFGIGAIVCGAALSVPALIANRLGYDMQTIDTLYEGLALVSGLGGFVSFAGGILSYMHGNVEYIRKKETDSNSGTDKN